MKRNKSRIQRDEKRCYLCGRYGPTDKHHVFNGPERSKSEEDGMYVFLHRSCHHKVHNDPETMREWKQIGQRIWEQTGTRGEFINRYTKSYIIEEEQDVRQRQSAEDNAGDPADQEQR